MQLYRIRSNVSFSKGLEVLNLLYQTDVATFVIINEIFRSHKIAFKDRLVSVDDEAGD